MLKYFKNELFNSKSELDSFLASYEPERLIIRSPTRMIRSYGSMRSYGPRAKRVFKSLIISRDAYAGRG